MHIQQQPPQTHAPRRRMLATALLVAFCLGLDADAATPALSERAKKLVDKILALAKEKAIDLEKTEALRTFALGQLADPETSFSKDVIAAIECRSKVAAAEAELEKQGELKRDSEAWKDRIAAAAKDCTDPAPSTGGMAPAPGKTDDKDNEYPAIPIGSKVNFYIGAISLNPYSLSKNTNGTYDFSPRDSASTDMFLELRYINRWSLSSKCETIADTNTMSSNGWLPWRGNKGNLFDVDARLGFVLRNSGTNQQFSANSAIGGGDFHSELNFGLPVFRQSYRSTGDEYPTHAHAINLEIGGGAVTEKTFQAVHPIAFAGIGYHASFRAPFSLDKEKSKKKEGDEYTSYGTFSTRIGIGWIDQPEFTDVTGTTVKAERNLPRFSLDAHPVWESEVYYPIPNKNIMLTIAGRMYFADAPAPWTISVGLNVGLDRVMGLFQ